MVRSPKLKRKRGLRQHEAAPNERKMKIERNWEQAHERKNHAVRERINTRNMTNSLIRVGWTR